MEIIVPEPEKFDFKRRRVSTTTSTLGENLKAQYGNIINPIISQNEFYSGAGGEEVYDQNSISRVEDYINDNGIVGPEADELRAFGIGSLENFQSTLRSIEEKQKNLENLSRASTLNLIVSDPALHVSLLIPYAGMSAANKFAGALRASASRSTALRNQSTFQEFTQGRASFSDPRYLDVRLFRDFVSAKQTMSSKKFSVAQLARIGALDAGVVDGSINLTLALTEISEGQDPLDAMANAALYTAGATAIGGLMGYGVGRVANRPRTALNREATFNKAYKKFLNSVSEKPTETGEDLSFTGSWFTNSWFMKSVPTPVRATIQDSDLPEWPKLEMLELGGDNGMPFAMNQVGRSVGSSTFIETGRRQGDWFKALDVINKDYRTVNPNSGGAEFLSIPLGEYAEKIKRKIGRDSFAPDEWYNHIGRLMVDEVPFDKMTPQEASSVQAARSFFEKYGDELQSLGIINVKDVYEDSYLKNVGRQMELQSVTRSIIQQNKKWMEPQLNKETIGIEKINNKLKALNKTQASRGLTKKQLEFRTSLEKQLVESQDKQAALQDLFDKIEEANSIEELALLYDKLRLTEKMSDGLQTLSKSMQETSVRITNALDVLKSKGTKSPNNYLMRIFNRRKIEQDTNAFKQILIKYFKENPEVISKNDDGLFVRQQLATDPASLDRRAQETIDNILGETDEDSVDAIFTGYGRSGPLISRRLDIPNSLIKDYIVTDIKEIMIAYTNRVAPRIEYHKRFSDPKSGKLMSLEARINYYRERLTKEGVKEVTIDKFIKNFVAIYDQVVGTTLKRPDAIDTKVADFLRTATSWTFLGGSGLAAIGDGASILMDHELNVIGKSFLGLMDDVSFKASKRELNLAGEALEIVRGVTHLKYMESLSNNLFNKTLPDKLNNAFYIANGLAPVTIAIKVLDGLLRGHTIVEASSRLVAGNASKFEIEFLARYNITPDLAKKISESPFDTSEGGLFLPNTEAWTDEDAVIAFRNALNSGVMNRVIMGTPADKPIVMSGVAYIPDSIASKLPFDLPADPRVKGYRRVESGLLALPFTFYSYTMGALSKITANHAAGSVRNRLSHAAVAMGLGSLIVSTRTPDWAWDKMDTEDKIMRAFDFSGLAAIYTDMAYRAITMASETGLGNNFPIQPKFQASPDKLGAAVSVFGAPADWTYEVLSGIGQMLQGDVKDGAQQMIKMAPLATTIMTGNALKDMANEMVEGLPNRP